MTGPTASSAEQPTSSAPPLRTQVASIAASFCAHLVLLGMLAAWILPREQPDAPLFISTTVTEGEQQELEPLDPLADGLFSSSSSAAPAVSSATFAPVTFSTQAVVPDAEAEQPLNVSRIEGPADPFSEEVGEVRSLLPGDGEGASGSGSGGGGSFFGLQLDGQSVVFVVDASKSMNHPHPGPAKTRFGRVKLELLHTVARMTEDEKFFVMFFNDVAVPMPATRLMEATPDAQRRYLRWVAEARAGGLTEPAGALALALKLEPDVIYFLTDGDFAYRVVPMVTKLNRGRTIIHTIGFGDNEGEPFLKEIASKNRGRYRFIPADEDIPPNPVQTTSKEGAGKS